MLRSRKWFDNPDDREMTALYLERYLNYGLTREELQSDRPIIGIAQTGSDLSPCNRHHIELSKRVRDGINAAGGTVIEIPVHPIQETGKRPTAMLDRNLAYLSLVETLFGYPIDGVVLNIGCDKTTPALLMAAATVNIPAIALSVGPMLNGYYRGERTGSGTIVWKARELLATGEIDDDGFMELVASSAPSTGYCNTMGTATTMNSLAEALGMQLPGSAAIPAPYRERGQIAYATGKRKNAVARVWIKPGSGKVTVNGKEFEIFFARPVLRMIVQQPLDATDNRGSFDILCTVSGGGLSGQAGAIRHGISKALLNYEPQNRAVLKSGGFLTRDSRVVERKKYGRAKARKSFQFSKR